MQSFFLLLLLVVLSMARSSLFFLILLNIFANPMHQKAKASHVKMTLFQVVGRQFLPDNANPET